MITPLEPEVAETGRYSVTETCKILGIHRKTLQRHTDEMAIKCGIRRSNGRKFYKGDEIKRYWKAQL
ncbi:helix-turn-helix domain-containing protein [Sunxiuqinia indica]|uniref:helix-turn-helix domain-containing protein n=1 Tax=Sunxiuqinia indica TaxID=2692584 RepID=UPI0013573E9A|nr:helix-turn-helix domain-containing protein [Sunxiuqinia indica]